MTKNKKNFVKVKPTDTNVDTKYQRDYDERRATVMANNLDLNVVGVPVLAKREDGNYVRIDGQHRLAALIIAGRGDHPVLCEVYEGLTVEEEAALFLKLNSGRSAVKAFDKFKARLVAKHEDAMDIVAILKKAGLRVSKVPGKNCVCAVKSVEQVYFKENLGRTVTILKQWCDGESEAFDSTLLKALSEFLVEYDYISDDELLDRLRKKAPSWMIAKVKRTKETLGCSWREAGCVTFRDIYNERRRRFMIPPLGQPRPDVNAPAEAN